MALDNYMSYAKGSPRLYYESLYCGILPIVIKPSGLPKFGFVLYQKTVYYVGTKIDINNKKPVQCIRWCIDPTKIVIGIPLKACTPLYILADNKLYNAPMIRYDAVLEGVIEHPQNNNMMIPIGLPIYYKSKLLYKEYVITKFGIMLGLPVHPTRGWNYRKINNPYLIDLNPNYNMLENLIKKSLQNYLSFHNRALNSHNEIKQEENKSTIII